MAYTFLTQYNSPNFTKGRGGNKIASLTIHWWGAPSSNPSFNGVVNWLCNSASGVSAHEVITGTGRQVACVVNHSDTAWHAGNWTGNQTSIGLELDPRCRNEDYDVAAERIADLWKFYGKLPLVPHKNWTATQCLPIDTTELLTRNGWVRLADIKVSDQVATAHLDDLSIKFSPVLDVVEPYESDTWLARGVEATADHRMIYSTQRNPTQNRVGFWNEVSKKPGYYLPNAGKHSGAGLSLNDTEIRLLTAIQADGHYMYENRKMVDGIRLKTSTKNYCGIEFHLKKERKIELISDLLDDTGYEYSINTRSDGSVSLRCYDKNILEFSRKWLDNKCFTWEWLKLSHNQAEVFMDSILDFDGCRAGNDYSSNDKINIDIVSAIASMNGIGVRQQSNTRISFTRARRSITSSPVRKAKSKKKLVGCVTVESGFFLIRQNGRTTIVGNCPGNYDLNRLAREAERKLNPPAPAKPKLTPPAATKLPKKLEFTAKIDASVWDLNTHPNWKAVTTLKKGAKFIAYAQINFNNSVYYVTEYSYGKGLKNGVNQVDLVPVQPPKPAPEPTPATPEPAPELPVTEKPGYEDLDVRLTKLEALVEKIANFLTSIFNNFKRG